MMLSEESPDPFPNKKPRRNWSRRATFLFKLLASRIRWRAYALGGGDTARS
nr:unnamed protein product [Callosobruchus chinensis]